MEAATVTWGDMARFPKTMGIRPRNPRNFRCFIIFFFQPNHPFPWRRQSSIPALWRGERVKRVRQLAQRQAAEGWRVSPVQHGCQSGRGAGGLSRSQPHPAQQRAGCRTLERHRRGPPTSGGASQKWRLPGWPQVRAGLAQRGRVRTRSWHSWSQRPPSSAPSTRKRWPPARSSSGYRRCLRARASCKAVPSWVAARGRGRPVLVRGETTVTSQHRATPRAVAPWTTRSSRRRSSGGTPGAVVLLSHCWGTTRPSGPTASRQILIQACSMRCPRRARAPVRGQAARWSPNGSTRRPQP